MRHADEDGTQQHEDGVVVCASPPAPPHLLYIRPLQHQIAIRWPHKRRSFVAEIECHPLIGCGRCDGAWGGGEEGGGGDEGGGGEVGAGVGNERVAEIEVGERDHCEKRRRHATHEHRFGQTLR